MINSRSIPAVPVPVKTRWLRFGAFEVDLQTRELRKHGLKIRLQDQPFQVLARLLERPAEMVSREELRRELWPADTFVDFDVGLNNAIKRLREAIGDSAESPRYIETLPRRGYRFIAPITSVPTFDETVTGTANGGVEETAAADFAQPKSEARRWELPVRKVRLAAGVVVGLIALVVTIAWKPWRQKTPAISTPVQIRSIAVLPLDNLTGDPAQDYFANGITDALITDLAQISSLRVISRTSAMRYKGTGKTIPEIARELKVDGIVEGAVSRSGERVRVNAQLIEAGSDQHFWARSYERNLGDVVVLQSEVARAIADAIQVKLTQQEQARLTQVHSVDPQAYEFYLKGRYFWNKRTNASILKSIDYFEKAIQREPNYALAYAGMAEAYIPREDLSPQETFSRAKAAAHAALQMDDSLAEAHNALAMSLFCYDWDWAGAEKEFQRAIALNPNYAQAHQWYGRFQKAMGRQNWAAEVQRAHELDPLSLTIAGGGWYLEKGQYDLAIGNMRKKLELDPNNAFGHVWLGKVYARKGMYPEAIIQIKRGLSLDEESPAYLTALGYTYGISGNRDEAIKILRHLTLLSKRSYVSPYDIALVYVGLGEKDLAFNWLQKALVERSPALALLREAEIRGEMDNLRADPRYAELKRRIGLPQ